MQEALGGGPDFDQLSLPGHVQPVQGAHRIFRLAVSGAEGRKIVMTHEHLRCGMHRLVVQQLRHPPRPMRLQSKGSSAVDDAVKIVALQRGEPCVKAIPRRRHVNDRDPLSSHPKMRVQRVAQRVGLPVPGEIRMDDLTLCVNAGVGAASASYENGFAR